MLNKIFKPTIPILRIQGGINYKQAKIVEESLRAIPRMKALAVVVDSTGGAVVQSELITTKIQTFVKQHNIPLYTFVEDCALSAGYFILTIGDKIFVDESSLVGSIGVLYLNLKIQEITKKLGFEPRKFESSKKLFSGYLGLNDEIDPEMENLIDKQVVNLQQQFLNHCLKYRPQLSQQQSEIKQQIFNASFFTGKNAVKYGLADEIGRFEEVLTKLHPDCKLQDITRIPLSSYYMNKMNS